MEEKNLKYLNPVSTAQLLCGRSSYPVRRTIVLLAVNVSTIYPQDPSRYALVMGWMNVWTSCLFRHRPQFRRPAHRQVVITL